MKQCLGEDKKKTGMCSLEGGLFHHRGGGWKEGLLYSCTKISGMCRMRTEPGREKVWKGLKQNSIRPSLLANRKDKIR